MTSLERIAEFQNRDKAAIMKFKQEALVVTSLMVFIVLFAILFSFFTTIVRQAMAQSNQEALPQVVAPLIIQEVQSEETVPTEEVDQAYFTTSVAEAADPINDPLEDISQIDPADKADRGYTLRFERQYPSRIHFVAIR